MVAGF